MPPSKKNLKATKKFEKKHLKGVLEKRKATAKIKQRQQTKASKQAKRAKDAEFHKSSRGDSESGAPVRSNGSKRDYKVSAMSVDDFFQGGFEILEENVLGKKASGKLGKRKREEPDGAGDSDIESESGISIEEQPVVSDSEDGSEMEDGVDTGMSKETMDALAKKDPEFYKFLKENDPEALDFDENADLAEVDDLSAGEENSEKEQPKKKRKKDKKQDASDDETPQGNELTQAMVARWKKSMIDTHSLRAARQVVLAFRSAVHLSQDDTDESRQRYKISSPLVFHDILIVALTQIPLVVEKHLPIKQSASGKVYVATDSKQFKTLSTLLKTYTASVIHLLGTLSDEGTLKLTISSILPILPHLLSFRKLLKALMKTVVTFWARPASTETTRLTAFRVLDRLVRIGDRGLRETVLKSIYQGLVQGCRVTNANTITGINLMKNSAAQLWGIDQGIGYTTAFTFIRQLAIHLRNSIVHNQKEAYKMVYNWQYTHSLDFWSRVLSEHCSPLKEAEAGKEGQLRLLIYPLVQVTLGVMGLIPSAMYFPLRFHLIRSLLRLSRSTGTYIPLASSLLEVLNSAEMRKPPKPSSLKPMDFSIAYKAQKAYLRTRVYQDGLGEQVIELFGEYFALWATNIAFPEFALPVIIQLKRWLKQARKNSTGNKNGKVVSGLVLLVQKLEANGKFIEEKRAKVDFAPKDRAQVDAFLKDFDSEKTPLGAYVVAQGKAREERAKAMAEARKEDPRKRKDEEREALEDEDEDVEMEEDGKEEEIDEFSEEAFENFEMEEGDE